jgi:hypothetical protein
VSDVGHCAADGVGVEEFGICRAMMYREGERKTAQALCMLVSERKILPPLARSRGGMAVQPLKMAVVWLWRISIVLVLACTGCDGDHDVAEFDVSCTTVSCFNVDSTDSFISDEGTEFIVCTWSCANYRAFEDASVELTFGRRPDGCFELRSEFVADGMC